MRNDTKLRAAAIATSIALTFSGGVAIADEAATAATTDGEQTAQVTDTEQDTQTDDADQAAQAAGADQTSTDATKGDGVTTDATKGAEADASDVTKTEGTAGASDAGSTSTEAAASQETELSALATSDEMASEGWVEAPTREGYTTQDINGYRIYTNEWGHQVFWAKISDDGTPMTPRSGSSVQFDDVEMDGYRLVWIGIPMVQRVVNLSDVNPDELVSYGPNSKAYWYQNSAWGLGEDGRLYQIINGDPGAPSGVSASTDTASNSVRMASATRYDSGTSTLTPATGTAYVSPSASAATTTTSTSTEAATTEAATAAIPATSDATSLAGAAAAAISAAGAFLGAKALRRRD